MKAVTTIPTAAVGLLLLATGCTADPYRDIAPAPQLTPDGGDRSNANSPVTRRDQGISSGQGSPAAGTLF